MKKEISNHTFQNMKKLIPFVLPAIMATVAIVLCLAGIFPPGNRNHVVISALTPPASAGEPSDSGDPAELDNESDLEAYVECLRRFHARAAELMNESDTWVTGFAGFGNKANVASFKQAVDDLKGKITPLITAAETAINDARTGKIGNVAASRDKYGDELGRQAMLLAGMKANYQIEVKRKEEADDAVNAVEAFFTKTIAEMRDVEKKFKENMAIAATELVKERERKRFQLAGEYLIVAGKRWTDKTRGKIVAIFSEAYKPNLKTPVDPNPFNGSRVVDVDDDPLKAEGELPRLRDLQNSGDYRAVLRLKYEVMEPLYSCRGYLNYLKDDYVQLRKVFEKELIEKRNEDNLYYMLWRVRTNEGGKIIETTDEWADEASWRRYDHWPLGTKIVKRRGELDEKIIMPEKQPGDKGE